MTILENIRGPRDLKALSETELRELSEADLLALTWLPDAVGTAVYRRLHGLDTPSPTEKRRAEVASSATMDES